MKEDVTVLLHRVQKGHRDAEEQLLAAVYTQLKQIARAHLRGAADDQTLQPTALVNEAYLKLAGFHGDWNDRTHFFRTASRAMRQIVVDHARQHLAQKRGHRELVLPLNEELLPCGSRPQQILDLDEALERLGRADPRALAVIELRFFGGLSVEEIAAVLKVSARTVKRDWRAGRAWLHGELRRA